MPKPPSESLPKPIWAVMPVASSMVDLLVARDQPQRAEEAGRVAGREQQFGVDALAAAAHLLRRAGVQVDLAVGGLHVAVAAAAGCG